MRRNIINILVIIAVITITGIIRLPIEQKLGTELQEKKLIPPPVKLETRLAMKQIGFTAGFGSLRPTIAAFMSMGASNSHSRQDWVGLEEKYNNIVLLDPTNYFYWDMASWHLISNAAGSSRDNTDLPLTTRRRLFLEYIHKGEAFIANGIKQNPEDWKIRRLSPRHYSNRFRRPNYSRAADEYKEILKMKDIPEGDHILMKRARLYALNKSPSRHQEAYDLALELLKEDPRNKVTSIICSVWVGQNHPLNTVTEPMRLDELIPERSVAHRLLKIYWKTRNPLEKKYGLKESIIQLERQLIIPNSKRLFPVTPFFLKHYNAKTKSFK